MAYILVLTLLLATAAHSEFDSSAAWSSGCIDIMFGETRVWAFLSRTGHPKPGRFQSLDIVTLQEIASAAEELDVALVIATAFGDWNDVIEFKVVLRSTVGTLTAIGGPDSLANISCDMA